MFAPVRTIVAASSTEEYIATLKALAAEQDGGS